MVAATTPFPEPSASATAGAASPCGIDTTPPPCGHVTTPPPDDDPPATLDERFAEAWINLPWHEVCGRRLRPYCFQHALALHLIDSPFVAAEDRSIRWSDLFMAAAICACAFEEHPREPVSLQMANYVLGHRLTRWLTRGHLGTTLAIEAARFRAYQNDYQSEPDLFFEDEGRELSAPAILGRAVFLQRVCHIPEERAWTMPIGKALWTYAAALEQSQPGVSLLNEEEGDLFDWIKKVQSGEIPLPSELQPEALEQNGAPARINPAVFGPES
jgi:hypothetical protein